MTPRIFYLERSEDTSGVSGTGRVAEGVQFSDGRIILDWCLSRSVTVTSGKAGLAVYDCIEDCIAVHGHEGRTKVVFDDSGLVACDQLQQEVTDVYAENTRPMHIASDNVKLREALNAYYQEHQDFKRKVNWVQSCECHLCKLARAALAQSNKEPQG